MRIVERKSSHLNGSSDLYQIILEQDGLYYLLEGPKYGNRIFFSVHTEKPSLDRDDAWKQFQRWMHDCTLHKGISDHWVKRVDYYPEAFMAELIL